LAAVYETLDAYLTEFNEVPNGPLSKNYGASV
jgi:hypothetical protein